MTQQPPKKSTALHKAPVSKAIAIPEASLGKCTLSPGCPRIVQGRLET
jgi:hypothetical protein